MWHWPCVELHSLHAQENYKKLLKNDEYQIKNPPSIVPRVEEEFEKSFTFMST